MARGRKVVFDAGMLILLLQDRAAAPVHPDSKKPIDKPRDRIEHLKETLTAQKCKILIPTPVLSEFLVGAGAAIDGYMDTLHSDFCFEVVPFSELAAIEAAIVTYQASHIRKDKKDGVDADWQKVKVDRQIVAIAKIHEVDFIYTTDKHILRHAEVCEIPAVHLADLPLPPETLRGDLQFEEAKTEIVEARSDAQSTDLQRSGDRPSEGQAAPKAEPERTNVIKKKPRAKRG